MNKADTSCRIVMIQTFIHTVTVDIPVLVRIFFLRSYNVKFLTAQIMRFGFN